MSSNDNIRIRAIKGYIGSYLKWKAIETDADGKTITPEHTKRYEQFCKELKDLGETFP